MKILVVGDWQNAHVTARCLAHLGHAVWHIGETGAFPKPLDIDEPGLDTLPYGPPHGSGSLLRTCEPTLPGGVGEDPVVWIALDTPYAADGTPDVEPVIAAAKRFAHVGSPILVTSQVPIGTCARMYRETGRDVVYVPENMRLGDGVTGFLRPDRLVVGFNVTAPDALKRKVLGLLDGIGGERIVTDRHTAEMIKHATNAWLACNIALANELATLGEPFGVDMAAVTKALRADGRIGKRAPLVAGDGFGGTLARDVTALAGLPGAVLVKAVREANLARVRSREMAIWKKERETHPFPATCPKCGQSMSAHVGPVFAQPCPVPPAYLRCGHVEGHAGPHHFETSGPKGAMQCQVYGWTDGAKRPAP